MLYVYHVKLEGPLQLHRLQHLHPGGGETQVRLSAHVSLCKAVEHFKTTTKLRKRIERHVTDIPSCDGQLFTGNTGNTNRQQSDPTL